MKERIEKTYGSVANMLKETDTFISYGYMYQILRGDYTNVSLSIAKELKRILKLSSLDEVAELIDEIK